MQQHGNHATLLYKSCMFLLYAAAYSVLYILPNLRPEFPPIYLPLLKIDLSTPFVPWTFIVYISAYAQALFVIVALKDIESFNAFCRRMFAGLFICGVFFLLMPTTYPRPPYPHIASGLSSLCMWLVRTADTPNNCFPSMHVAMSVISVLSLRNVSKQTIALCGVWAAAICLSTLTTKQHYFVDVMGGTGVALTVTYLHHVFEKRYLRPSAGL